MYIDIIVLITLIIFIMSGFSLGFFVQFISIFGLIGNLFLAKYLTPIGIKFFKIQDKAESEMTIYILIFIAIYISLSILTSILNKFFSVQKKGMFNRLGGIIISLTKGIIICIILISGFKIIQKKYPNFEKFNVNSIAVSYSEKMIPFIYSYLPETIKISLEDIRNDEIVDKYIKKFL
ncbi:MAG: CvpA family protein [Fusobacteriaceae bacterium]